MSVPTRLKFGYAAMIEKEAIRHRLLAAGAADDMSLLFEIEAEYISAHADDTPYRDKTVRSTHAPTMFTQAELTHLAEHFANANDPISVSIGQKALALVQMA